MSSLCLLWTRAPPCANPTPRVRNDANPNTTGRRRPSDGQGAFLPTVTNTVSAMHGHGVLQNTSSKFCGSLCCCCGSAQRWQIPTTINLSNLALKKHDSAKERNRDCSKSAGWQSSYSSLVSTIIYSRTKPG